MKHDVSLFKYHDVTRIICIWLLFLQYDIDNKISRLHPSTHPSICPSVCQSYCLSAHLCIQPSDHPASYSSICRSIQLSMYPSIYHPI
jgi:hypothetical protein